MVRRYYRRRNVNRDKYSVEQTTIATPLPAQWELQPAIEDSIAESRQVAFSILPPSDLQGTRKVKHFELTFSTENPSSKFYYVLAYVPQGYLPQRVNLPVGGYAISAYEANQFVLSQGMLDFDGGPLRIRTPLSRNLNSGDSVYLIIATYSSAPGSGLTASVRYAITLQ